MSKSKTELSTKIIFNCLANAKHIFAFKEEEISFKLLKLVVTEDSTTAVVETSDGEICGLYTDSASAKSSLQELESVFGSDQPFVKVNIRETPKKQSVYYIEVL